jgi:phosphoglycerate dehydrogenase-like enzyme/predicted dehydrogenase
MTRVLLIGCGKIARQVHLPALVRLREAGRVDVGVYDIDSDLAAAVGGERRLDVVTDWRAATDDYDAAVVCAPPGANSAVATDAVTAGLHVLCEKPPGRSVDQAEPMAAAAIARPDLVTMVGFNRRYIPAVRDAWSRSEAIAPPNSFYGRFSRMALGEAPSNTASDWITSDSVHTLDLAVAVMGFPEGVAVTRHAVGGSLDNVWTLQLRCPNGTALVLLNYAAGARLEVAEWTGPGYDVRIEVPGAASWARDRTWVPIPQDPNLPQEEALGFLGEHVAFLDAIEGGPRPACDFSYGADFMRLVEVVLSAEPGREQPIARDTRAHAATPTAGSGRSRSSAERPIVVIHQPVATHGRYFAPEALAELATVAEVRTLTATDDVGTALADAHALVTGRGAPRLPPGALDGATLLELVTVLGSSVAFLGPEPLLARGVRLCSTADAVALGVAEHCLMVTLAGLRLLTQNDAAFRVGRWGLRPPPTPTPATSTRGEPRASVLAGLRRLVPLSVKERLHARSAAVRRFSASAAGTPTLPPAADLHGAVVGLLGWGHSARHFADLLRPFSCTVLVWSEFAEPTELAEHGARPASLAEILGGARVVSLHRGLTDATRGFLDTGRLSELRPGAVLVNTARGRLIDEAALVARLRRGDIVAALDVFDDEPLPADHALRALPNTILTPHNAGNTAQELTRMGNQALGYAAAWARGDSVPALDATRISTMT